MAYRWETSSSVWLEDAQSGQFALESMPGLHRIDWHGRAAARLHDVAQLLGATLPQACHCSAIFPPQFAFCPQCGKPLTPPAAHTAPPASDWWGPCNDLHQPDHVPHGLPITTLPLAASIEQREALPAIGTADRRMPRPPNPQVAFAAARFGFGSQRLVALAYLRNVLQYWDPLAKRWHLLHGTHDGGDLGDISFSASDYGWLPAAHADARLGEVGLIPAQQGLLRLLINPISETYHTETVLEAALASAPGALQKHIACLINHDGRLRLWHALFDTSNPHLIHCDTDNLPLRDWSRPVSYDNKLMWLHQDGHLLWQVGDERAQWIAWPNGWNPRLTLGGPTQSRDGRLWLMGHDGQAYSFLELGKPHPQIEMLDGARLGFGGLLFRRGHIITGDPWATELVEDPHAGNDWVLPLLRNFDHRRSHASGLVLRFSGIDKADDAVQAKNLAVSVKWIGRRDVILAHIPRLSRPADCVPFIYDNCLWLHNPHMDEILGWNLDGLDGADAVNAAGAADRLDAA
jgi:hypothetical protein